MEFIKPKNIKNAAFVLIGISGIWFFSYIIYNLTNNTTPKLNIAEIPFILSSFTVSLSTLFMKTEED